MPSLDPEPLILSPIHPDCLVGDLLGCPLRHHLAGWIVFLLLQLWHPQGLSCQGLWHSGIYVSGISTCE